MAEGAEPKSENFKVGTCRVTLQSSDEYLRIGVVDLTTQRLFKDDYFIKNFVLVGFPPSLSVSQCIEIVKSAMDTATIQYCSGTNGDHQLHDAYAEGDLLTLVLSQKLGPVQMNYALKLTETERDPIQILLAITEDMRAELESVKTEAAANAKEIRKLRRENDKIKRQLESNEKKQAQQLPIAAGAVKSRALSAADNETQLDVGEGTGEGRHSVGSRADSKQMKAMKAKGMVPKQAHNQGLQLAVWTSASHSKDGFRWQWDKPMIEAPYGLFFVTENKDAITFLKPGSYHIHGVGACNHEPVKDFPLRQLYVQINGKVVFQSITNTNTAKICNASMTFSFVHKMKENDMLWVSQNQKMIMDDPQCSRLVIQRLGP